MNELIDKSQIPSDYGGSGPALAESASGVGSNVGERRKVVAYNHLFQIVKKQKPQSHQFIVGDDQGLVLKVYSRCNAGAKIELYKGDSKNALITIDVIGDSGKEEEPYSRTIGTFIGPEKYTLKITGTAPGSFLVLGIMNG